MNESYKQYLQEGQAAGLRYAIASPRRVQQGLIGSQLGGRTGSSLEFMDHRQYTPGDDLRWIDWNAFARSDKLSIKMYRDEVSPHVDILLDVSRSMNLGESAKAQALLALAGCFAQAAWNSGYSFTAWQIGSTCRKVQRGQEMPELWDGIDFKEQADSGEVLKGFPLNWRPRGIRIFLSDLFWFSDPRTALSVLADRASAIFLIQILAQADDEPPAYGNLRLVDSETGRMRELYLDETARQRYRDNLAKHQSNWNRAAHQFGAQMTTVIAETLVADWDLHALLEAEILRVK